MATKPPPAPAPLAIEFPKSDGDKVSVADGQPYTLSPYGTDATDNKNQIDATLTVNGAPVPNKSITRQPRLWAVSFPFGKDAIVFDTTYTLTVTDTLHRTQVRTFKFEKQKAPIGGLNNLLAPPPGSTVPGSGFVVTITTNFSVYAGIQRPGGPWYGGTYVAGPSDWVISFDGIPPGDNYAITVVVWTNPPQFHIIGNIKVT
jgi:hypothetical protein